MRGRPPGFGVLRVKTMLAMKRPNSTIRREKGRRVRSHEVPVAIGPETVITCRSPKLENEGMLGPNHKSLAKKRGSAVSVTIVERESGTPLAKAEVGENLAKYESNWYFDPGAVQIGLLRVTDRTYTCPFKGTCNWVDYIGPDGRTVRDVGWVYPKVKPGHELIEGRFGFYAGNRAGTREES
jgi:uncharacterized protein (DUF427 family)